MKRNKIRYKSEVKEEKLITLTGVVFLMFRDEEELLQAQKGDVLVHPQNDALHTTRQGDYGSSGFAGYFKVDVCDGKEWCPVSLPELFPDREHHFSKTEYPIDTFGVCEERLQSLSGQSLRRTYREHYELVEGEGEE